MAYTGSMAGTFAQRHQRATDAALRAAANVVVNGLKDDKPLGLNQGYTTGAYVTGNLLNSIFTTDPQKDGGGWHIMVATNVKYAVYWEFGHYNIFIANKGGRGSTIGANDGAYVREERWLPTLIRTQGESFKAYQRVYARFMS